jgi:hypothetical protein
VARLATSIGGVMCGKVLSGIPSTSPSPTLPLTHTRNVGPADPNLEGMAAHPGTTIRRMRRARGLGPTPRAGVSAKPSPSGRPRMTPRHRNSTSTCCFIHSTGKKVPRRVQCPPRVARGHRTRRGPAIGTARAAGPGPSAPCARDRVRMTREARRFDRRGMVALWLQWALQPFNNFQATALQTHDRLKWCRPETRGNRMRNPHDHLDLRREMASVGDAK